MHAEILDVDVAAQASVEEQVPPGVMIVVVDIHAIAFPFPIAAAIQVIGGNHPIRIVVEHHATRTEIHPPRNKICSHVLVSAIRIGAPRPDAVVLGIPVRMGVALIVPAPVISVVMPVAAIVAMFVVAWVLVLIVLLATITVVVALLPRCGDSQGSCQGHEQCSRNDFSHRASLQKIRCRPTLPYSPVQSLSVRLFEGRLVASSYYHPYRHPLPRPRVPDFLFIRILRRAVAARRQRPSLAGGFFFPRGRRIY